MTEGWREFQDPAYGQGVWHLVESRHVQARTGVEFTTVCGNTFRIPDDGDATASTAEVDPPEDGLTCPRCTVGW